MEAERSAVRDNLFDSIVKERVLRSQLPGLDVWKYKDYCLTEGKNLEIN